MSTISAPYRFVPLSKLVFLPDWGERVSHDQPFADGVCGELTIELKTHTDLCVGGEQTPASDTQPGEIHFFRTPDDKLAIPGSSIKGMLRNVLEIASFARFKQVEDQRLGVRDISAANNFYCKAITRMPAKAGWLQFNDGQWSITPCRYARLHQEQLIKYYGIKQEAWVKLKSATERYQGEVLESATKRYQGKVLGVCPEIKIKADIQTDRYGKPIATPDKNAQQQGQVVVTGQPGSDFTRKKAKKYEFVFYNPEPQSALTISSQVMGGFKQIHEHSSEWSFWLKQLNTKNLPKHGIPVFYHTDDKTGAVSSLGLAMMYKLAYTYSLHQAIQHTDGAHLAEADTADLPDLLFGRLNDTKMSLRGRVNIGVATLAESPNNSLSWKGPCILNSPKPTFYPFYIRQDRKNNSFRQLMEDHSELAGWKRYSVKPLNVQEPATKSGLKVQVKLETVAADCRFNFKLRFHNLRRVELGALLWALDFGDTKYRHALGAGKPFGLGQVSLKIVEQHLRTNQSDERYSSEPQIYLEACKKEFVDLMDQIVKEVTGKDEKWLDCGPLKALLEYATPVSQQAVQSYCYLPDTRDFVDLKKTNQLESIINDFHGYRCLEVIKGKIGVLRFDYQDGFLRNFELKKSELQKKQTKEQHEKQLAQATEQGKILLEIGWLISELKVKETDTLSKKIEKTLRAAYEKYENFSSEQKSKLKTLAEECQKIMTENKPIQKICKKILEKS